MIPEAAPTAKQARAPRTEVISIRAVLCGILLFCGLVGIALVWRLSATSEALSKLREFEFTVAEPVMDEFELDDPMRDILEERPENVDEMDQVEEKPDIHMTVKPTDVKVVEEVIQTDNVEVETPDISPDSTQIEVDAPQEITEVADNVTYAANVIAAKLPGPGDIFQYDQPAPRDKPREYFINRAPRPSRTMTSLPKQFGNQDAPSMGDLGPININLFGTGDFFRTMTRWGGLEAKSAVDAALYWLAVHQEAEGRWDAAKYEGGGNVDVGVSGLALLALMGGGNTVRKGEYRRNVLRGVEWMLKKQNPQDGSISKNIYEHSIASIALCEAYGRARDERVGKAARKAVAYLEKGVNPDCGWRYTANCGQSDMSVTAWAVQALKTAKLAEVKFDHAVYSRSLTFVDSVTDRGGTRESTGGAGYTYVDSQEYGNHPAMTAAAMVVRQFSGIGVKSHLLAKGAELLRKSPPTWTGTRDFYMWYYATYAMHNMGGENRVWWNRRVRDVLVENQLKRGDHAGSWDPKGTRWGDRAGRVYTTALGALCLEVYYRYSEALNSFGVAPDIDDLFLQ